MNVEENDYMSGSQPSLEGEVVTNVPSTNNGEGFSIEDVSKSNTDKLTKININDCLKSANDCLKSADKLVASFTDGVAKWKEIDKQMLDMEHNFKALSKEMDNDLEKYKSRIPVVESLMNKITDNLSKILDKVLDMDPKTEWEMDYKLKLMAQVDSFMNTISMYLMKLM